MVNIYASLYENERMINGRTKLFIKSTDDDGTIEDHEYGIAFTPNSTGTMFIVDDWIIPQINKLKFEDGEVKVKDGEGIEEPQKTEKELEREQLLNRLAEFETE